MGKRKTADEAALRELEQALEDLVDAAERRAGSALGEADRRQAVRDLHRARARLGAWQRAHPAPMNDDEAGEGEGSAA
jgi:hypothetical protein